MEILITIIKKIYSCFLDVNNVWEFLGEKLSFVPAPILIFCTGFMAFCLVAAFLVFMVMLQTWLERKIAGHIQSRHGPMRCGMFHGWAQPIADTIKLLLKEDITPKAVDIWVFRLAPIVVIIPSVMAYACLPLGRGLIPTELKLGVIYITAITSMVVIAIIMAGWSTANKYAAMSAFRSAAQIVSYEVPMIISVLTAIMIVGSYTMSDFVNYQNPLWLVFTPLGFVAFMVYFISSVAETNRAPFDLPEAEAELVAGFFVEYTGIKFALFFFAEYTNMVTVAAVASTLFLGGWRFFGLETIIPPFFIILAKIIILVSLIIAFRWTFPRLRVDQLMNFCWKVLLPVSLINFTLTGLVVVFGGFDYIYINNNFIQNYWMPFYQFLSSLVL